MRVNGNLRGLAWAASGGAVYSPTQAAAVPGARGGGWGGSPVYMGAPPAPAPAPAVVARPVALGPAARPVGAMTLPGASLGPSSSAPAAVVTAPVPDGTSTMSALIAPGPAPAVAPVLPLGLLMALLFGTQ
ncbi:MAG TPA: hypothetical protein VNO25_07005 [Streptosporangiaceae bacterium]|nr:hypothetical protein [Streptosporangiaceae bacterium]